jgi:hypothetical protein
MNILVELKDGVSLQIPFREASKVFFVSSAPAEVLKCHTFTELAMGW